ncbi:MAG: hypothetical protein KH415_08235 [Clostridium sp.]|nr:hypothetical protein [Clostridium sp.]
MEPQLAHPEILTAIPDGFTDGGLVFKLTDGKMKFVLPSGGGIRPILFSPQNGQFIITPPFI